jgi:membrane protease YdiL (CAAX protease family)
MSKRRAVYALIGLGVFALADSAQQLFFSRVSWPTRLVLGNAAEFVLTVAGIVLMQLDRSQPFRELGLRAPPLRALAFALLATVPMSLGFALTSKLNPALSLTSVLLFCVIAPFAEEVLFRGYLFRQLYQRARWPFWLAMIAPSVLFALEHAYQARGALDLLGVFAITGTGSLLFCWVFRRWQYNLWAPFFVHAAMNFWWELFAVDETALGGVFANAARIATVVIAVVLTLFKDRIWPRLAIEDANLHLEDPAPDSDSVRRVASAGAVAAALP